ncbi:amino acid adenylation domain-containing protein [Singulisphaera sp. Ch08]|uniref:Amino acid adenylation domain-containing protein n=1 Tax=Singulisphaera sp. Ch08 TaxID=3120278 RepID=A0AAU7C9A0_9BACT
MGISQESLAGLSLAEKRMLLAQLLQEERASRTAVFPLSHGQRGLWFLYQMDRRSPAYNVCYPARVRSPIDLDAFRRAAQTLVQRHPSLRTTFEERDGEMLQRVHENLPVPFEVIDASPWSEETLRTRLEAEAHRPFDLERGPLWRMHLFTRAPNDHVLLLGVHHIVGDFWSLILVIEEMQSLYPAECRGQPACLPAPGQQYHDFVRWQNDLLASPDGERLRNYWHRQLAGAPTVLEVPTDRPRPTLFSNRGGAEPWQVGPGLARRLKALAASEGTTLYTALLTAFQVLLGRYTGQDDFLVGSPFAGRSRAEFEGVIGYFINMLPLRANLSGDPSFLALLRRTGTTVLDALGHQDYPFALIVERENVARDLSRPPLVQVTFTLEKAQRAQRLGAWRFFLPPSGAKLTVGGLQMEQYYVEQHSCQSDLEMVFEEGDGTLEGMLRYNVDLFEAATVRRMVGHFLTLLQSVADGPDRRLSQLPCLTEPERRLVLDDWNRTEVDFPRDLCLHHLFEHQAARTPNALALQSDEASLTFAELEARSNRLAHRLRRLGVGPGAFVPLFLERSPAQIVAILATLKAGGVYVPIDPGTPAERIRLVLADTAPAVVLTQHSLRGRLPETEAALLFPDDPALAPEGDDDDATRPPDSGVRSSDLAYVIYTSGSTGRPKGVMVEHRAIVNTVHWRDRDLTLFATDRVLYNLSYTFDPSLCIIFPTLAIGGALVLAAPGEEHDPRRLLERVIRERVTVLEATANVLRLMLDDPLFDACRDLRGIYCGGEAMPTDLPARVLDRLNVTLSNLYGPTEAAVDSTWWACRRDDPRPSVPIGRPVANTRAYVLDPALQPVPPGIPGELYLGGAGLARGYLKNPAQTAERFLPDPFSARPGARLYRTGDRVRWLSDGTLEFLGRLDHQVKVRGFRVELGEVEAALMSHPAVREAVVIAQTGAGSDSRLIAYVTGDGELPAPEALRRYLKDRLPDHMVPSIFVPLPALPRTAGGKVDRRALPTPPQQRPDLDRPYVAPRTPLEEFLAGLWRDVLHLDKIGVEDHFFELGGTSIQGAVLINRIQKALDQPVYVIALFDSPTIADLARHLGASYPDVVGRLFGPSSLPAGPAQAVGADPTPAQGGLILTLQPEGSRPPCFMVHPPGGIVVCYQALAQRLGRDRPFHAIRARGLHDESEPLPSRMETMAADYLAAVRAIQPSGPYYLGGWSVGGLVALEMAQQLRADGERINLLALLDTTPPSPPGAPPLDDDAGREYGLDISLEQLATLGPDRQLPYLWQHALKLGLVGPDVPMGVAQQVVDSLKRLFHHHMLLASQYVPRPYPSRITLFRPSDAPIAIATTRDRGWGSLAATVEVHFVPGQHHSMVQEPHVQALARVFADCLQRAETYHSDTVLLR